MQPRPKSPMYPSVTWNECMDLIREIDAFKLPAVSSLEIAKKFGLSSTTTSSHKMRLSTAKQYGLITISGETIHLTDTSRKLLYPTNDDTKSLVLTCFSSPAIYSRLIEQYNGASLPPEEKLGNIMMEKFGITKGAKSNAAKCFIESAEQLGYLRGGVFSSANDIMYTETLEESSNEKEENEPEFCEEEKSNNMPAIKQSLGSESDYIIQSVPMESGKVAKIIIPNDADEDSLLLLKDTFDAILKRKFKIEL